MGATRTGTEGHWAGARGGQRQGACGINTSHSDTGAPETAQNGAKLSVVLVLILILIVILIRFLREIKIKITIRSNAKSLT